MNEDLKSRLHACLTVETEKYHQAIRRILVPRLGGTPGDIASWVGSLTVEQRARLSQAAQELLNGFPLSSHSRSGPHSVAQPFRAKSSHPHGLSEVRINEFSTLIGDLHAYQIAHGLSDGEFVRRFPALGSGRTWRYRLVKWQPRNLNLMNWLARLSRVCECLDESEPGWRCRNGQAAHPVEQFSGLMRILTTAPEGEKKWSQRKAAKRAGVNWTTWRRLTAPDAALHFHLPTWLPRLRESVNRLGA